MSDLWRQKSNTFWLLSFPLSDSLQMTNQALIFLLPVEDRIQLVREPVYDAVITHQPFQLRGRVSTLGCGGDYASVTMSRNDMKTSGLLYSYHFLRYRESVRKLFVFI